MNAESKVVLKIVVKGKTYKCASAFGNRGSITLYDDSGFAIAKVDAKAITYIGWELEK